MEEIEKHIFEDINFFPNEMKTLILGTFPVPLFSQKEKFDSMPKDKKENSWYYSSSRSEFWKLKRFFAIRISLLYSLLITFRSCCIHLVNIMYNCL